MSYPSQPTIKRLFAISNNNCAFPNCPMPLVDEESGSVTAQICHIKAKNSGGERYDATQTNQQRDAYENLVLMCPHHHKMIDDDPKSYTVEKLDKIKAHHESGSFAPVSQTNFEKLFGEFLQSVIKAKPQKLDKEVESKQQLSIEINFENSNDGDYLENTYLSENGIDKQMRVMIQSQSNNVLDLEVFCVLDSKPIVDIPLFIRGSRSITAFRLQNGKRQFIDVAHYRASDKSIHLNSLSEFYYIISDNKLRNDNELKITLKVLGDIQPCLKRFAFYVNEKGFQVREI